MPETLEPPPATVQAPRVAATDAALRSFKSGVDPGPVSSGLGRAPAGGQHGASAVSEAGIKSAGEGCGKTLPLTVLYDGACPLCRREIGLYRRLRPNAPVCFADLSDCTQPLPPDSTREQLLARFHVRRSDGELLSGAQAFLALWATLPGWRWLARAGRLPGAAWVLERIYRLFLRGRPALQRWASRLARTGD
jgi:predicted DCC family thiol-disulfide oxidoreductase YuxK